MGPLCGLSLWGALTALPRNGIWESAVGLCPFWALGQVNARRRLKWHQHVTTTRSCTARRAMLACLDQRDTALPEVLVQYCQWILENMETFQLSMLIGLISYVICSFCLGRSLKYYSLSDNGYWYLIHLTSLAGCYWMASVPNGYNLVIPCCRLSTYSTRAFSLAGPVCWNALPDYLKSSDLSFDCFRQQLKHFYFVNIDTSPCTTLAH